MHRAIIGATCTLSRQNFQLGGHISIDESVTPPSLKKVWFTNYAVRPTVGTPATTTSRRRGRPVIDGGSRGAVGLATQVAGASAASHVDVGEADT